MQSLIESINFFNIASMGLVLVIFLWILLVLRFFLSFGARNRVSSSLAVASKSMLEFLNKTAIPNSWHDFTFGVVTLVFLLQEAWHIVTADGLLTGVKPLGKAVLILLGSGSIIDAMSVEGALLIPGFLFGIACLLGVHIWFHSILESATNRFSFWVRLGGMLCSAIIAFILILYSVNHFGRYFVGNFVLLPFAAQAPFLTVLAGVLLLVAMSYMSLRCLLGFCRYFLRFTLKSHFSLYAFITLSMGYVTWFFSNISKFN